MALITGSTKVEIVSQAFERLGKPRPTNDLDDTPTSSAAARAYDTLLMDTFSSHYWRFAMVVKELNQLTSTPPLNEWRFAYQLPENYITLYRIDPNVDFSIFENRVFANIDKPLKMVYVSKVSEENFPAYFVELMILMLASKIAMSVTENLQIKNDLSIETEKQFVKSRSLDAKAQPNVFIQKNDIFNAHFGL